MEIIKKMASTITWAEIAEAKAAKTMDKLLAERDVINFNLRGGEAVSVTVEKVEPGRAWMGFTDAVTERPMYGQIARPVSWKNSDARHWLNAEFVNELPEELPALITPRTIRQTVQGEELETTDMLWLHSVTELFGRRDWASGDDQTEEQLPIYRTERDRVKMFGGVTTLHYTRSVYSGSSHYFCRVGTGGAAGISNANTSWALPPGFFI